MPSPPSRPPPRVRPCRCDRRDDDREDEERAEHDAIDPAGVGDERQAREEEERQREDVEAAVEHDRREAPPAGERSPRHPARPEQIADPAGQHVVHRHAGDDHLDELPLAEPRVGDLPPARCLQPVDEPHAGDRCRERDEPDVLERAPDGAEIGPADREEEEDRGGRDADDRRDRKRAAASASPGVRQRWRAARGADCRFGNDGHARRMRTVPFRGQRQRSRSTLALRLDR